MISPVTRPATVLVVDDDGATRRLVGFALRRAGFDVLEADGGAAAMYAVATEIVDLVVLDIRMPGMTGTDVVQALRSRTESATLPILLMSGSGDDDSVILGLEAGADDFVPKPVRLDELVARVNAHLRKQTAWSHVVEDELRNRATVVAALSRIAISTVPEEAAEAVVQELGKRTDSDHVAVLQLGASDQLQRLATYNRSAGVRRGGHALSPAIARRILDRARTGPWVEDVNPATFRESTSTFAPAVAGLAAGAPIYSGDELVGILTIGVSSNAGSAPLVRRAKLLASAIDYANVLSTTAGSAFADRRDVASTRARLREVLTDHLYHTVFQPIVDLETRSVMGFEALTRFDDGTDPAVRFAEAVGMGLGPDYELATIRAAVDGGKGLPGDGFLSINLSPGFVLNGDRRFRQLLKGSARPLVLELTEHMPIDDYGLVRDALAAHGSVGVAVDDAGSGYSSLRHILELRPTYAKLDISLVRGIDGDDLRQALAAGLQYFAFKIGCRLIAEGVETDQEADALQRLGVAYGQGYLFGRPELAAPSA